MPFGKVTLPATHSEPQAMGTRRFLRLTLMSEHKGNPELLLKLWIDCPTTNEWRRKFITKTHADLIFRRASRFWVATSLAFYRRSQKGLSLKKLRKKVWKGVPGASQPRGRESPKKVEKGWKRAKNSKNLKIVIFDSFRVFSTPGPGNAFSDFFRSFLGRGLFDSCRRPTMLQFLRCFRKENSKEMPAVSRFTGVYLFFEVCFRHKVVHFFLPCSHKKCRAQMTTTKIIWDIVFSSSI